MIKQFFKYVLPAMLAFAFSGVYAIVDGFFIGRSIGDAGLAAINIAYPITALIQAVGTGIGMGGAIQIAVGLGKDEKDRVKEYLGNTLSLLFILCVVMTLVLYFFATPLLHFFGAKGEILPFAKEYIQVIILGALFQIFGTGMIPIIRNFGGSLTAMFSMIAGFITNIILDYLFVFVLQYGMGGAAWATILGQFVTSIPAILYFILKKEWFDVKAFKLKLRVVKKIVAVGISPFGLTLSPNIVLIIMNKFSMSYGGEEAVAIYAVISYVIIVVQLLLQGVGDGCQPLISRYYGQGNSTAIESIRKLAYYFAAFIASCNMILIFLLKEEIPIMFGVSSAITPQVIKTLPIFIIGFLFSGFLRITISYFYATRKNRMAYLLIYGEPAVLFLLLFFVFPTFMGINGVWISAPVSQIILSVIGGCLYVYSYRRMNKNRE